MLHQSTLYRLATVVALFLCATLAVAQSVRVADIGDKFVRNYVVVERGYDLSDTIEVSFFELDSFKSGSITVPVGKTGELIQFVKGNQSRLFVLRGMTDAGKFVRTTMDMNTLLNILLGNGRANATASAILNYDSFVDVIYASALNTERAVGIWSLPLATKFGAQHTVFPEWVKALPKQTQLLQNQINATDAKLDAFISASNKRDENHKYLGLIVTFGLRGALVSGRLNDPYGIYIAGQLKASENFGVEAGVTLNRIAEGRGGVGANLDFILGKVVVGTGYTVFGNYDLFPWARHFKNMDFSLGYEIAIPNTAMILVPYAGVNLSLNLGEDYDGVWRINAVQPEIGVKAKLINLKFGDVQ